MLKNKNFSDRCLNRIKLISGEIVTAQEAKDAETEVEESDDVE